MKTSIKLFLMTTLGASIISCGGGSSSSEAVAPTSNTPAPPPPTAPSPVARFSLGLSDAPVDDALEVNIELDSIRLINTDESQGRKETLIGTFTDSNNTTVDTIQVNLLDFQGDAQIKIIDEAQGIELANGIYQMELVVVDAGSYVLLNNDATQYPIKVPSSRLRLGDFTVTDTAVQVNDDPAYTIEFDLRQSLVLLGNLNNNNGFIIKPNGIRVVSLAGNISGTVSADFTNLGQCTVYLYDSAVTEYGDIFDPNDEAFEMPEQPITATAPLATTQVAVDGTYSIGFIQPNSYQVALRCGVDVDDNIQFDDLTIPSAGDITPDVQAAEVTTGQTTTVNF